MMAEPTPFQLAARKRLPRVTVQTVYARDPYNFPTPPQRPGASTTLASGLWQGIPACGPNAAGATPPTKYQSVAETIITVTGSIAPEYGDNNG
jgi:hypothetical protein